MANETVKVGVLAALMTTVVQALHQSQGVNGSQDLQPLKDHISKLEEHQAVLSNEPSDSEAKISGDEADIVDIKNALQILHDGLMNQPANTNTASAGTGAAGNGTIAGVAGAAGGAASGGGAAAVAPVVSDITPSTGSINGGDTINITGTGLTGATGATIGGAPATINVTSDNSATVITPQQHAGVSNLVVTNAAGSSTPVPFTFG